MENNNILVPQQFPKIKLFDIFFNREKDEFFDVSSNSLDEIMERIGVMLDAFIVLLEMKGDEDPSQILNGIVSSYKPELNDAQINPKLWDIGRDDSKYIKRRNKYIENLLILLKLKIIFIYGINSIIESSEEHFSFVETNSQDFIDFDILDRDEEIHSGASIIKKYALFKWIEPFIELFVSRKKTTIGYSYLFRMCYQDKTLPEFVDTSIMLVNQNIDRKIEEYKKCIGFSYFAIDITTQENLNKKLESVKKSIESLSVDFPKIKEKFIEKKRGCLAGMKFQKGHYAAISGISMEGEKELGAVLSERYGVTLIPLKMSVRYYFNNNQYITYQDFYDWRAKHSCNDRFLRMFSCCERKLLTKCYDSKIRKDENCLMYVTLAPCQMCVRAINKLEDEKELKVKIRCTNSIKKSDMIDEDEFVRLAESIF